MRARAAKSSRWRQGTVLSLPFRDGGQPVPDQESTSSRIRQLNSSPRLPTLSAHRGAHVREGS